jgi:hypothetical protein
MEFILYMTVLIGNASRRIIAVGRSDLGRHRGQHADLPLQPGPGKEPPYAGRRIYRSFNDQKMHQVGFAKDFEQVCNRCVFNGAPVQGL